MPVLLAVFSLFLLAAADLSAQKEAILPVSGRPPTVFWKRGMAVPDAALHSTALAITAPSNPLPATMMSAPRLISAGTREQVLVALRSVEPGAIRSEVLSKLGPPAYVIGIPDGNHYIERCRFRLGSENLAIIEFRDGLVSSVNRFDR